MQKVFKNGFLMMSSKRSEKIILVDLKQKVEKNLEHFLQICFPPPSRKLKILFNLVKFFRNLQFAQLTMHALMFSIKANFNFDVDQGSAQHSYFPLIYAMNAMKV